MYRMERSGRLRRSKNERRRSVTMKRITGSATCVGPWLKASPFTRPSKRVQAITAPTLNITNKASETWQRSGEHTSELQSLMRISYAVFCLTKKKQEQTYNAQN